MSSHTGKIARLPRPLREELNRRLEQNEPGPAILSWLNSLPGVQTLLAASFDGKPINLQNLSNWRRGAFTEWQNRENFLHGLRTLAADAADISDALGSGPVAITMTEHASRLLALHFARLLCPPETVRGQPSAVPAPSSAVIKSLCEISRAINSLRRTDLAAARLEWQRQYQHQHQPVPASRRENTPAPAPAPAPAPMENPPANTNALAPHIPPPRSPDATPAAINPCPAPGLSPASPSAHSVTFLPPRIKLHQASSTLLFPVPTPAPAIRAYTAPLALSLPLSLHASDHPAVPPFHPPPKS